MFRRTRLTVVAVAALGLLLAGCGGSHDMDDMGMASPSSTTGASAADAMFAQMMIPHHQQAVVMADLAQTRASSPVITDLAARIRAAQQPEIDLMTGWLQQWGVPVLSEQEAMASHGGHSMSGMLTPEQLDELAAASGAAFDRRFAELMIAHHQGAVEMAREVVGSANPQVASLAGEIIDAQQAEIGELQAFLDAG